MLVSVRKSVGGVVVLVSMLMFVEAGSVRGATVLSENFASDPVAGGRAVVAAGDTGRFTFSGGSHALTAAYNTLNPTALLKWSLGRTFNQNTSFSYSVDFNVHLTGFSADPNGFAQIAFGLINSGTTGLDRTGSFSNFTSDNTYDIVTVDYFPNISNFFASPSLQPTIMQTNSGADAFAGILSPFGAETAINGAGESDLPRDVTLTATVTYDATAHRLVLRMAGPGGPLNINAVGAGGALGGADGDPSTIDLDVPTGAAFSVDSFALTLWNDGFSDPQTASVKANVGFSSISVSDTPEPASLALLGAGVVGLLGMRRRQREACPLQRA